MKEFKISKRLLIHTAVTPGGFVMFAAARLFKKKHAMSVEYCYDILPTWRLVGFFESGVAVYIPLVGGFKFCRLPIGSD